MSEEQNVDSDGGGQVKRTLYIVGALVVAVLGGGYLLISWATTTPPAPSRVDLNQVGNSGGARQNTTESQHYRELLRENNAQGAAAAAAQNKSFIASIPLEQDVIVTKSETAVSDNARPVSARAASNQTAPARTEEQVRLINDARQKALTALLTRMQPPETVADLPEAQEIGGKQGSWSSWADSLPGSAVRQAAMRIRQAQADSRPPVQVVAPYWRGPGEIYTGVDSDNSTTPVLGRFVTGPYAGAVLKAPDGAKLAGDGVVIHFTTMNFKGLDYKVDAYALQDDSLVANIASSVNHHYFRRIVLPAIFGGVGAAGGLYSQANTQVLSNGLSTVTARPGLPSGSALTGVIAGGMATQAAQVLNSDNSHEPDRTVSVTAGQTVAIQFMSPVYSTDVQSSKDGASQNVAAQTFSQSVTPSPTAAELSADTAARIRAAEQRGASRE